jgi:hypothetical protein
MRGKASEVLVDAAKRDGERHRNDDHGHQQRLAGPTAYPVASK